MALLTPWLLDQIRDGNAILFLGAGATLGAVGPNDERPLDGMQLRDRLSDRFLGGGLKDRTLSEVAEYAKNESSLREVQRYIYELFEPLAPAPHHLLIPSFRWHAIITTNYDFLVERAYEKATPPLQNPIRISRDGDADRADFGSPLSVPYLKLHGCLSSISEDSPPLILSTEEYARHRESRERVFGLFADWAQAHPILFCGYKIGDPNIQQILFDLGDGTVNRHPYAVVDPTLVAFDIRYWQSRRFIPQRSSFEDFLVELDSHIPRHSRQLSVLRSPNASSIHRRVVRGEPTRELLLYIDQELVHVREGMPMVQTTPADFFKGLSDSWYPIASGWDVERRFVDELLVAAVLEPRADNRVEIYLLKGHAGSGKSIALRRTAWNAAVQHEAFVFWLKQGGRLNIDHLRHLYTLTEERVYLFVEDALQELAGIRALATIAIRESIPLTLVLGARTNEWNTVDDVHELVITDEFELRDLSNREIAQLLSTLAANRCLGHLDLLNSEERHDHFRLSAQRQLLVALHEATLGKPFEQIVLDEYMNLVPAEAQALYLDVATFHRFRVPLRAGLVSRVSGINLEYFRDKLFRPLEHVVKVTYDLRSRDYAYETRHPVIADLVCRQALTNPDDRAGQIIRLVRLMNVDYQSDQVAFENLIRGRDLADLFDDRVFVDRIFLAAEEAAASASHVAHQRAVFELQHPSGNVHYALDALRVAEEHVESSRGRASIRHTRATALRRLAQGLPNLVQRDRVRAEAKDILLRLIRGRRPSPHPYSTLTHILLDDLKERLGMLEDADPTDIEPRHRQIGSLVRETERVVHHGLQQFPGHSYLLSSESELAELLNDAPRAADALRGALVANPGDGFISIRLSRLYSRDGMTEASKTVLVRCLESNPTNREAHVELAKLLSADNEYAYRDEIRNHLRRGFTPGDTNYDAQFWYARHEFLYGDVAIARTTFSTLSQANISPGTKQQVRGKVRQEDGKPKHYRGHVRHKSESYCFVSSPELPDDVFMHPGSLHDNDWDSVTGISQIDFELAFSFRGAVGVNGVLIR